MKKVFVIAAAALLAAALLVLALAGCDNVTAAVSAGAGSAEEHSGQGEADNTYDQIIAHWSAAIALDPEDVYAYIWRGTDYYFRGLFSSIPEYGVEEEYDQAGAIADYDRAIADFNRAISLDHDNANAYYWRGWAYAGKGDYDKAIALDPNDWRAYSFRASAYEEKGDYDRAITDYSAAIALDPDDWWTYYNRADAYDAKGDEASAEADREKEAALLERVKAQGDQAGPVMPVYGAVLW